MNRRQFINTGLKTAATTVGIAATPLQRSWAKQADARIEIMLNEPGATISPTLYGQFTEHIGGVIYDGVWVGENSSIPNRYGVRAALIDKLKQIKVPLIRWPGGCFADSYDWKDGIGPHSRRPRRTSFWEVDGDEARLHEKGAQVFEPNAFGTNEFMRFCNLSGAEPYVAANVRSLSALEFDHWVEYCNSPAGSTTLAEERGAAGFPDPFKVRYWGIGNESWGCGGNFTPEEYASEFRRYTSWIPRYGLDLNLIGSGPNDNDIDWTHRFFEQIHGSHSYDNSSFVGWSIHHYASNLGKGKVHALQFDSELWYALLKECDQTEKIIQDQWSVMGQYDTTHRIKLVVDEYGPWYLEGTELHPEHIFGQQITMRDALATALTLDIFNRNADKVAIATNAQLINNINALFLAHEDRFIVTPNFHVFDLYAAHQGGQSLRTEFAAPQIAYQHNGSSHNLWGLNGSASRKGSTVTLTVVNTNISAPSETQIALRDGKPVKASAITIVSSDVHAHNTFEEPNAVHPISLAITLEGSLLNITLPPASVTSITISLA